MSHLQKVIFLCVKDNQTKLQRLSTIVHEHFQKSENVLIAVPNDEAASYIDHLLWKLPEESFTPHAIVKGTTKERVAITTSTANVNQATILINLCPNTHASSNSYPIIYELLDLTHPTKEQLSRQRQAAYQSQGIPTDEI